jgi:UDP-N-acetylglucosamine diphosphorylase/glucosamine-1-phosphate N-acetyltransferase
MKAIILAAGIGKRMQPIQKDKCLLKFLGKELILHQIEMLERCGIKEFIIICNPRSMEKIKNLVGEKAEYVMQREANGMADALLSIKNPPKEALIVGISDLLEESAYENILKKKEGDAIILGYRVKEYFPGGYLITEGEKVKGVVEKPGEGNEPSSLVNIVVHVHKKFNKLLEYMKNTKSDSDDVYELSMARMMKESYDFRFVSYDGAWVPIKYPWHILDATKFFLDRIYNKISRSAEISKKVTITGKVFIDDGVKILENAVIRGPCYIGKNSVIGNGTLVCGCSHIGERCVIGFVSEVKHSYLGDNVWLHRNYVGDSVIMDNCNLGAGAAVANWRFDRQPVKVNVGGEKISTGMEKFGSIIGENCKIGINVSIMPGIKIGPNATVGAHLLVSKDVGGGKFLLLKQEIEEIENVK